MKIVYYVFSTVLASTVAYVLTSLISINGWIGLIIKAIVCVASSVFVMVILLCRMKEFSDALYLIARMFHLEKLLKKCQEKFNFEKKKEIEKDFAAKLKDLENSEIQKSNKILSEIKLNYEKEIDELEYVKILKN